MCLGGQVVTRLSRGRFKPVVPSWRPLYVRGVPVAGAVLLVPVIKAITLRGLVDRKPHVYITEDSRDPLITLRCCREARSLCDHGQHGLCAWGGKSLPDLVGDGSSPSCPPGGRHACGVFPWPAPRYWCQEDRNRQPYLPVQCAHTGGHTVT